ncbi:MAG: putative ATPase/tRNA A-37 threonylcarbamoyl transferase component Bud32, partial [Kiritimatiellia bacterium]
MHNVQWLEPGTPVDRYVVQDRLGEGGMAKVYEVTHAVLGTRHALKVLHSRSDAISERLLREGRLQARLDPAYVIPVTDVIEIDGSPALVMPLVDGCSLAELLDDHRPTESEVGAIFANVVAGVASAHDAGVVHRDLKPTNVLLEIKRGQVHIRVADFGVARAVDVDHGQTRAGAMMGTPAYAAPEQIHDASTADHRADLWSLGVILFELLTGKRPFRADSLAGLFRASAAGDYDHTAVPERWRSVVDSLLQPDRTERLRSASELVNRLADMVEPVSLAVGSPVAEVVRLRVVGRAQERADLAESIEATLAPSTRHNLPQERDVFAGRERDLVALKDSVSHSLLVSVVGLGGVGKTRLVLHHCRRHLAEWPGGVRFCDLSDARSVQGICYAVGRALDVPLGAGDPVAQLGGAIASRGRCLMILDNFEQVARYASETVGQWLDRDTEAVFVVTTREVLGLPGETVLSLAPLDLSDSVEMFIARAEAAKQGFCANDDDRAVIAELVALLDHLPLAIELAAARVRVMPPRKMVLRMNDRFRLLTSTRGRGERQSTLRATLDWSWDLLEPWEQSALAQTSVFEGGFDLEAVESVLELHDDAPWALDVVQALVDKSLVRPLGEGRFDLLVSVQEYAAEQLAKVGADDVQVRHGRHYAAFGDERAIEALSLHGGPALRKALALELGNLVSSTGRAVARGDAEVAGATALAAAKVMDLTGPFHTEIAILRAAWQMSLSGPESPNDRVRAGKLRRALGFALDRSGRPDLALVHYDAVLATHRESGDRRQQGFLLID